MAEEETDSEGDGGKTSQPKGVQGSRNGSLQKNSGSANQREIQPFSTHQLTGRRPSCPMKHSHNICEETDLSFQSNCKWFHTSSGALKSPKISLAMCYTTHPSLFFSFSFSLILSLRLCNVITLSPSYIYKFTDREDILNCFKVCNLNYG